MIAAKRFVVSVIGKVSPVEFWFESMTGTSTLWSNECISPLAYFFSFLDVAMAVSAVSMLLGAISTDVLAVMDAWQAYSVR